MFGWVRGFYCVRSGAERWYIAAISMFFLSLWVGEWGEYVANIASLMMVIGFSLWCLPWIVHLKAAWEKPWARVPIVLLHLLALLIATVLSRSLVAVSLDLPPQTFELTVGFFVILLYIPAWLIMAAGLASALGFSLILIGAACSMVVNIQHQIVSMVRDFGWRLTPWRTRTTMMLHGVGASISGLFLLTGYVYLDEHYPSWLKYPVKLIAVKSDFYPVKNYPGFNSGEYIHPLENGMTAFVYPTPGWEIRIGVKAQGVPDASLSR